MSVAQALTGNLLLQTMGAGDYALLEPSLTRVAMPARMQLQFAHKKIGKVYFPEDGLVSIVAVSLDGKESEIGLFGREGMSDTASVLGEHRTPYATYVQIKGKSMLSLSAKALGDAIETSPTLHRHLLRYVQAMMIQMSSSIAAAHLTILGRLARRLLMTHDRIAGNVLYLTHDALRTMLTVRRSGVTKALHELAAAGMITMQRGSIAIIDRAALARLARGSHGLAESEYSRLIGEPLFRNRAVSAN